MAILKSDRLRDIINILSLVFLSMEVILSIVMLGITASAANGFKNYLGCDIPSKLNYNIAAAILTFAILPAISLLEKLAPAVWQRLGAMSAKIWLGIHSVFFILWAAAVGAAFYTCGDLCSVCGTVVPSFIIYAGKCCNCAGAFSEVKDFCDAQGDGALYVGYEHRHHWYEATQVLAISILILFALSIASLIALQFVKRQERIPHSDLDSANGMALEQPASTSEQIHSKPNEEPPPYGK